MTFCWLQQKGIRNNLLWRKLKKPPCNAHCVCVSKKKSCLSKGCCFKVFFCPWKKKELVFQTQVQSNIWSSNVQSVAFEKCRNYMFEKKLQFWSYYLCDLWSHSNLNKFFQVKNGNRICPYINNKMQYILRCESEIPLLPDAKITILNYSRFWKKTN